MAVLNPCLLSESTLISEPIPTCSLKLKVKNTTFYPVITGLPKLQQTTTGVCDRKTA
jgi:hypothetical protein